MTNKKKKITISVISLLLVLVVSAYFYLPKMLADQIYPLKYEDLIRKYATKYGVDPAWVAAEIFVESRFDPKAQSGTGANGLGQMMQKTTYKTMLAEVGRPANSDIYDPEVAIDTMTAHLRDLMVWSKGNRQYATAAYNLGTGGAARLGVNAVNNFGYVKKVDRAITVYSTIYSGQLGYNSSPVQLQAISTDEKTNQVKGFIWAQFFQNIFRLSL